MPFGEELGSGVGGRTTGMGYGAADGVRKKFTGYERDTETGLDYAQARYFSSTQGRFTSPDPLLASAKPTDPQSWNRYCYVGNNPMVLADPSGMIAQPGSFNIHNYSGGMAAESAAEGLSPWPDVPSVTPEAHQSNQQRIVQQPRISIDIGEPPPPLVNTVTIDVPEPREYINEPTTDGAFFTGVASNLQITPMDAAGNPITGIFVTETVTSSDGTPVIQRQTPAPVGTDGSFFDLVGVGLSPPPTTPISPQRAVTVLNQIAQRHTNQVTIQTLRFYAAAGYALGTAVVYRNVTNMNADGNVKPTTNRTGRPVDNYSTKVRLLTMLPPEK